VPATIKDAIQLKKPGFEMRVNDAASNVCHVRPYRRVRRSREQQLVAAQLEFESEV